MRLNPDVMRDILMECENRCTVKQHARFSPNDDGVLNENQYSYEEIHYHLRQCNMSGYFSRATEDFSGNFWVKDLTPKAHEFLADIRQESIWNQTKAVGKKLGVSSLTALLQIAQKVVEQAILSYFQ